MTGKELILFILQNNLENEEIIKDGVFVGLMDVKQAAAKFNVGEATIRIWNKQGLLKGMIVGDNLYFFKNSEDPRQDLQITLF